MCDVYKGGDSMEIKTEADSNECSHDDKPITGMFAVSDNDITACLYSDKPLLLCLLFSLF